MLASNGKIQRKTTHQRATEIIQSFAYFEFTLANVDFMLSLSSPNDTW